MKTTLQRRQTGQSAIAKAFGKPRGHNREAAQASTPRAGQVKSLRSQMSELVMEERVQLSTGLQTQERHLFLFNDTLIIAKSKLSSSLKLKVRVSLCEMWLSSCTEEVAERKLSNKQSFVIGWPVTNYVVTFSSSEIKEKWLLALQWQINKSKEGEYPNNVNMKIVLMDTGKSAMVAVNVDNKDDVNKIIKIVTQQLGLSGQPADYRLWVILGKDEAPHQLIGHELPYSIILHCLKETVGLRSTISTNLPTVDGRLFLDQLLKEASGQRFILRAKSVSGGQGGTAHSSQRHVKRRKSLIDWALRRGTPSPSQALPHSSASSQKLFGQSLSSICHHGNLPRPIMDMLYLLYHEGANTTGIFRRSANAKTCRELKEKLNSGGTVQLEGESVFVAAAVLTDFLRNLPGSVLSSGLYGQWMEALEGVDKIEMIQSLLRKLPADNITLLRYLFGLLYHIQEHSQNNQMNAFNLALCIAPNMLWPPGPTEPEEESQSTKKVAALIQLLIENTPTIFGDDVQRIFTEPKIESETSKVESCQQLYSLDDWDTERPDISPSSERKADLVPVRKLVLKKDKELFDFLDGTDFLKRQHINEDGACSWENIKEMSACSSSSSLVTPWGLTSARDRCASEPSVCLGSPQLPARIHIPVARQSSCDAAMMCGQHPPVSPGEELRRANGSRLVSGRSTFLRSPQAASRGWHHAQRLLTSSRSSVSSLSSTATSPSGSSLSSIDSAFCSDSLSFPSEGSSLPFLFGSSARLRPLTPDTPKKFPKDWSVAFPMPEDLEWCNEDDEEEEEGVGETEFYQSTCTQNSKEPNLLSPSLFKLKGRQKPDFHLMSREREDSLRRGEEQVHWKEKNEAPVTSEKTSIAHIQLKKTANVEVDGKNNREEVNRTKITFLSASNAALVRSQSDHFEGVCGVSLVTDTRGERQEDVELLSKTVKLHIPQTVFYSQNSSLVLQSVSTRQPPNARDDKVALLQTSLTHGHVMLGQLGRGNPPPQLSSKTVTKATSSISHTIRIKLPATVRNTVREYFSYSDSKSCNTDAKAIEKELLLSKQQRQSKMFDQKEKPSKLSQGEDSFV
ncbi:rho GTPase-activating protein 20 isoform X2 [Hypomesus transpacificus]|nr:rho GTPase-activating protein 20 isoform X2 [Hypomesus transpacificus]